MGQEEERFFEDLSRENAAESDGGDTTNKRV